MSDIHTKVMMSWEHVLKLGKYGIEVEDVKVHASGSFAMVTCVEYVNSGPTTGKIVATNIFEKQVDEWRIIHHHGSPGVTTL